MRLLRRICQSLLRFYPLTSGYERISFSPPLRFLAMGQRFMLLRLRNGLKILAFTKEHIGRILMYMGDLDPRITYVAGQLLKPGDTVLDVGANIGWFTLTTAPHVGELGVVHSFEPQPMLAALLRASVVVNGLRQVSVHEFALSDRDASIPLFVLRGNLGHASLTPPANGGAYDSFDVPTRHASGALEALQLSSIRMLKLDVEGHEATVVSAALDVLQRTPPDIVLFESNDDPLPFFSRHVVQLLLRLGYRIFGFENTIVSVKLRELVVNSADMLYCNDYVALHIGPALAQDMRRLGLKA